MPNYKRKFIRSYDKYIGKIYRFIFLKVSSKEIAEDLTSEVFMKTWNTFRDGKIIENFQAFVYRIAKNEIASHYRKKSKTQIVSADKTLLIDPRQDLEAEHQRRVNIEALKQSIAELKDDYQDVIIWRYLDRYPIKQIAGITGKSEGAVRVAIHRALKELRVKMAK